MNGKTICYINTTIGGSHGNIVANLAAAASKAGYSPLITYSRGVPNKAFPSVRIGSSLDMRVAGIGTRLLDNHGFMNTSATKAFLKKLDSIDIGLFHLHNIHGYYINVELLFSYIKNRNVPVVWTLHDCWSFTGHCAYFDRANCAKWQRKCHDCKAKREYPKSLVLDMSASNYMRKKNVFLGVRNLRVVTPSKWLTGNVSRSFLANYPSYTIHNGVDLDVFKPIAGRREDYVLCVASPFDERKGFTDTIRTAEAMPETKFVLVGLDERQMKSLPPNVVGITKTSDQTKLVELYSKASVFLNTTYEDTYPTVNMEAVACGTPVVSYNSGGCAEQHGGMRHGVFDSASATATDIGEIVYERTPERIAESIRRVMVRTDIHARQYACDHFDRSQAILAYIDMYNDILKRPSE